jgi:hypothetical protein
MRLKNFESSKKLRANHTEPKHHLFCQWGKKRDKRIKKLNLKKTKIILVSLI